MPASGPFEPHDPAKASDPRPSEDLVLDAHTRSDLRIFPDETDAASLFDFCNRCRTAGGERMLRRRMESPSASAERIRTTQDAVRFVLAHREAFQAIPSRYGLRSVETYLQGFMPVVTQRNPIAFGIAAFALKTSDDDFFIKIRRGVLYGRRLLRALREILSRTGELERAGEIGPLLAEMSSLLARPGVASVPEDEGGGVWKILRLDQVFRLQEKRAMERLVELVHELDALVSLASVTDEEGWTLPEIVTGPARMEAVGLRHPFVPDAVVNPIAMDEARRLLFLTGPNMAGKTTYLRAAATALYLAHLGMGVPATRFTFVPVERLLTSIATVDDLESGVSYFRAEALRVKAVAEAVAAGFRVVAVMDEPFKGTNVKDALDASLAVLDRFARAPDCLFLVSSHLIELADRLDEALPIDFRFFEAGESEARLRFDYRVRPGVSSQRLGMRVLQEEGIFDLLDGRAVSRGRSSEPGGT